MEKGHSDTAIFFSKAPSWKVGINNFLFYDHRVIEFEGSQFSLHKHYLLILSGFLHSRVQNLWGVQRRDGKCCSAHVWVCKDTDGSNSLTDTRNWKIVILSAPSLQGELINTWPTLHERTGSLVVWGVSGFRQSRHSISVWQFVFWSVRVFPPNLPHGLRPDWLTCERQPSPWGTLFGNRKGNPLQLHYISLKMNFFEPPTGGRFFSDEANKQICIFFLAVLAIKSSQKNTWIDMCNWGV